MYANRGGCLIFPNVSVCAMIICVVNALLSVVFFHPLIREVVVVHYCVRDMCDRTHGMCTRKGMLALRMTMP